MQSTTAPPLPSDFVSLLRWLGRRLWYLLVEAPRFIRPTLEGVFFILFTLMIGFGAMNTGAQLLYVMFSLMCGFWVLSAILATRNLVGLRVHRVAPLVVEAGRPARVMIQLQNGKRRLPTFSIRLRDELAGGVVAGVAFADHVPAGGSKQESYRVAFPRRGLVRMRAVRIGTRYPFGLIERSFPIPAPSEVLVLPQVIDVEWRLGPMMADLGDRALNRRGRGTGIRNIRTHQLGDSSRDIHWKLTARRGQLMVREYESEERREVVVAIDETLPAGADPAAAEEFELAVVLASSICAWLAASDHEFELRTKSGTTGMSSGPHHLTRCRRTLALLEANRGAAAGHELEESPPDAAVLEICWQAGRGPRIPGAVEVRVDTFREELVHALRAADGIEAQLSRSGEDES